MQHNDLLTLETSAPTNLLFPITYTLFTKQGGSRGRRIRRTAHPSRSIWSAALPRRFRKVARSSPRNFCPATNPPRRRLGTYPIEVRHLSPDFQSSRRDFPQRPAI